MKRKKCIAGFFTAIGFLALTTTCNAGGMNASESSVYAAASGTFTYEGQEYKAAPGYLAQLQEYLCRDDIDLTADQANSAIAEMYASVAEGVAQGYILPTGSGSASGTETPASGTTDPGTATNPSSTTNPGNKKEPESVENSGTGNGMESAGNSNAAENGDKSDVNTSSGAQSSNTQNGTTVTESGEQQSAQSSTDIGQSAEGGSVITSNGSTFGEVTEEQRQEQEKVLADRIPQENAGTKVNYDKSTQTLTLQTADGTEYQLLGDITKQFCAKFTQWWKFFAILACGLVVIGCALLLAFGCFSFQKNVPAYSHHSTRRVVRRVAGLLLSAALVLDILGAGSLLWMRLSCFNDNQILDSLSESGYYHKTYDEMITNVHALLKVSGSEENVCDEVLSFEKYMFTAKNQMRSTLEGKDTTTTFDEVEAELSAALANAESLSENAKGMLAGAVVVMYQAAVKNVVGDMAYVVSNTIYAGTKSAVVLYMISMVLAILMLLFSDRYKHRGVRKMGYSCILAGVIALVFGAWIGLAKPYTALYVSPDYLYLFLVCLIRSCIKVLMIIAGVCMVVGVLLEVIVHTMKKELKG